MHYSVFKTRWGWAGLLGDATGLRRACLPLAAREDVVYHLMAGLDVPVPAVRHWGDCQERVTAYFEGERVDFSEITVTVSDFGEFAQATLRALRQIRYGQTTDYSSLAALAGRPRAVRAAANAVAQNPLPLIIPCHRVLRKDGSLGGFSAPGGIDTKKRLLDWEIR